ncbi:hypothetical protein PINS_up011772 [Pythium insidiosum]|nr:hypothetical protein PINS_up011772 [Pythium insidiosum]
MTLSAVGAMETSEEATPVEAVEIDPSTARSADADLAAGEGLRLSTRQRYLAMRASRSALFDFQDDEPYDDHDAAQEPTDNQLLQTENADDHMMVFQSEAHPADEEDATVDQSDANDVAEDSALAYDAEIISAEHDYAEGNWEPGGSLSDVKTGNAAVETETLAVIWQYLHEKIVENQCTSQSEEIRNFVAAYLTPAQQRRQLPALVESLARELTREATARGEDVSLDVQSSLCILEQLSLTLGRASPFEDMYTSDEEELLEQLVT